MASIVRAFEFYEFKILQEFANFMNFKKIKEFNFAIFTQHRTQNPTIIVSKF